jgi:transposase
MSELYYPKQNFRIGDDRASLSLSKIGSIKLALAEGEYLSRKIKWEKCTLIRNPRTGTWYADLRYIPKQHSQRPRTCAIGMDIGTNFIVFSTTDRLPTPAHVSKRLKNIPYISRAETVFNYKHYFMSTMLLHLVKMVPIICIEDISLARDINTGYWRKFTDILEAKATSVGSKIIKVPPQYTSRRCSRCGRINPESDNSSSIYKCENPFCKLEIDRNVNAARNIVDRGLEKHIQAFNKKPEIPLEPCLQDLLLVFDELWTDPENTSHASYFNP